MMRVLDLALKDIKQILREKQSIFFLLIMPIAFTLLFGFAFGGFGDGEAEDQRLPVGLLDLDGGALADQLRVLLGGSELIRLVESEAEWGELEEQVREGALTAGLVIPAGYSQTPGDEPLPLQLIIEPANTTGYAIQGEIQVAATRLQSARTAAEIGAAYFPIPPPADELLAAVVAGWAEPPLQVRQVNQSATVANDEAAAAYGDNAFAHASPGMMAQFLMAGLLSAAQILVLERKSGALRRLLTTNMSRGQILLGHFLAMFLMILFQLVLLTLFGQFLLGLPYYGAPLATGLLILTASIFAGSMGLLIGALAKTEEQAIIFSLVPMFLFSALGGAWMPLEFTPATFQRLAYFTPIAWLVDGFKDVIIRGLGVEAVLTAALVLLLYSVVFWLLAGWRFRFE
ncbi:MAG: ABC transporter permease [Anaerolineales bacterium]|nr:ABC transporter permease [Anaerolineales bacterium]